MTTVRLNQELQSFTEASDERTTQHPFKPMESVTDVAF